MIPENEAATVSEEATISSSSSVHVERSITPEQLMNIPIDVLQQLSVEQLKEIKYKAAKVLRKKTKSSLKKKYEKLQESTREFNDEAINYLDANATSGSESEEGRCDVPGFGTRGGRPNCHHHRFHEMIMEDPFKFAPKFGGFGPVGPPPPPPEFFHRGGHHHHHYGHGFGGPGGPFGFGHGGPGGPGPIGPEFGFGHGGPKGHGPEFGEPPFFGHRGHHHHHGRELGGRGKRFFGVDDFEAPKSKEKYASQEKYASDSESVDSENDLVERFEKI